MLTPMGCQELVLVRKERTERGRVGERYRERERERERCSETTMMLVTCDGLYHLDTCCVQRLAWLAHTNAFY